MNDLAQLPWNLDVTGFDVDPLRIRRAGNLLYVQPRFRSSTNWIARRPNEGDVEVFIRDDGSGAPLELISLVESPLVSLPAVDEAFYELRS